MRRLLQIATVQYAMHYMKCINPIQSQIIELEPRPTLKKSGFSVQILIKLTF